ncbi:hypothetical protein [Sandaracinus amylolyticus]|uniref:Uncharacterized protein n=1 Tax=Sandaracinus amylolyticus TaxID=927083 RepID=A0A0F6YL57_9BACT|nr:hypothetical protein [Sandaracinus amylolyticus]AKF08947.1 hypothetical protein DB32_006096 [Sandaracinus amylolyticus]
MAALVVAVGHTAQAQPRALGLEVPACEVEWASFEQLAPLVRVELRALGIELDVVRATDANARLVVRAECDEGVPDASSIVLEAHDADGAPRARVIDLLDVSGWNRARTLAIALVDLHREGAPPEVVVPEPDELIAEGEVIADPVAPSAQRAVDPRARALDVPGAPVIEGGDALRIEGLELALGGALAIEARAADVLAGGQVEGSIALASSVLRAHAGLALSLRHAARDVSHGTLRLSLAGAALFADVAVVLGALDLGARLELTPGLAVSSGSATEDDVVEREAIDATFEASLLLQARWTIVDRFFVRVEGGATFVGRGIQLVFARERALGWTGWAFPIRVVLGIVI